MFNSEIRRKRGEELERLASDTKKRLSSVTKTTDSVHGVVLENNIYLSVWLLSLLMMLQVQGLS